MPAPIHVNLNAACEPQKTYTFTYTARADGTTTFALKSGQVSDAA